MKQTERIRHMEQCFDRASHVVMQLSEALDQLEEVKDDIRQLSSYYGSEQWKQDYAADEAGMLPQDLKRGVLSEDSIWNLLSELHDIQSRMADMLEATQTE